jgi:NAD(P)-dependent dehydrogenase (short-subunit alcohol dehydrogenase family)
MKISGKAFVVTGGGSGLGAAVTRLLAEAGARIVVADINPDAGAQIAANLGIKRPVSSAPTSPAKPTGRQRSTRPLRHSAICMAW